MKIGWTCEDYREPLGYEIVRLFNACGRLVPEEEDVPDVPHGTKVRRIKLRLRIRMTALRMDATARELDEWLIFCRAALDAARTTSRSLERLVIEKLQDRGFKLADFVSRNN